MEIIQSPCIRQCCLDDDDICIGCCRTLEDIKHWSMASDAEKLAILESAKHRQQVRTRRIIQK